MKQVLGSVLVACMLAALAACAAVQPRANGAVCLNSEEHAAWLAALAAANERIDELEWDALQARRKSEGHRTRNEGLKGYCS